MRNVKDYLASTTEDVVRRMGRETIFAKFDPHKKKNVTSMERYANYVHELILLARLEYKANINNLEVVQRIATAIKDIGPSRGRGSCSERNLLSFSMYWPAFKAVAEYGSSKANEYLLSWSNHWAWWFKQAFNGKGNHFKVIRSILEEYNVKFHQEIWFDVGHLKVELSQVGYMEYRVTLRLKA